MHTCMRCGRAMETAEEMQGGCTCGSKAFIFTKSYGEDATLPSPCTTPAVNIPEKSGESKEDDAETRAVEPQKQGETGTAAVALQQDAPEAAAAENPVQQATNAPEIPASEKASGEKGKNADALPPVIEGFEAEGEFFIKPIEVAKKENGFEVENVRLLESGVFEVDVLSLAKNPLVLKDQNDVYYVKLPLSGDVSFLGNGKIEKQQIAKEKPQS